MKHVDGLAAEVLRGLRVVRSSLQEAVEETARDCWPTLRPGDVEVDDFRNGTLHVMVDSHARMAEARGFLGETFREGVNARLGRREPYVSRLVFRVRGTA